MINHLCFYDLTYCRFSPVTDDKLLIVDLRPFSPSPIAFIISLPYLSHVFSFSGWNITTLSRHKNWRDFHAVLGFLGSSGTLMSIINTLSHDHNVMYDYPLARLPYHYQQKYQQQKSPQSHVAHHSMFLLSSNPGQDGFQHLPTQQTPTSISLTPFEYYIYHFVGRGNCNTNGLNDGIVLMIYFITGLIAQTNEWYQSSVMENDSLYPMVFEDYLSYFLPIGGAVFKFGSSAGMMSHPHPGSCSSLSRSQQHLFQSPGLSSSKHSLLRSDFAFSATSPASNLSSDGYGNFHPGPALGGGGDNGGRDLSVEARRSHIFVEVVTRFWIQGSMENVGTRGVVQVPSSDVVKLVRMFVKHSHYFFNSFHEAHAELKDNLKQTLFRDFFGKLSFFFEYLFDHWPLDASFRLVLETWLSYIQPWRYRDPAAGQDDRSGGEFQPGKWDQFIQDHIEYYNRLLAKIVMRFFRLDLSSNKNAFMLFRLTKVLNQDGLMANLRNVFALEYSGSKLSGSRVMTPKHGDRSSNNKSFGSSHEAAETFGNIFDEEFKNALNSLVVKVVEAKLSVQMQKNSLIAAESDKRGSGSVLTSIIQFLFSNGPQTNR